jgi:hypothetical protein
MNPGPELVQLNVAGDSIELDAGKLYDAVVTVESDFAIGSFRGEQTDDIEVDLRPNSEAVSLVDLGGDAAYLILDVSPIYNSTEPPKSLPVVHVAKPAKVHSIPLPALKLVRPGRPIPEKGSWELKAAQGASTTIEIYKVFRVDPRRLDDQAKLVEVLTAAVISKTTGDYENMRTFVDVNKTETHEGVIPKLK